MQIYHRERDWVNARGSTDVKTWEGAKYEYKAHSGKGSELKFTSGKRAFEVNRAARVEVNFPETTVAVSGGQPLAVDHSVELYGAGANETVAFATGAGPSFSNKWEVNVGPTNTIGHGAGPHGRWALQQPAWVPDGPLCHAITHVSPVCCNSLEHQQLPSIPLPCIKGSPTPPMVIFPTSSLGCRLESLMSDEAASCSLHVEGTLCHSQAGLRQTQPFIAPFPTSLRHTDWEPD